MGFFSNLFRKKKIKKVRKKANNKKKSVKRKIVKNKKTTNKNISKEINLSPVMKKELELDKKYQKDKFAKKKSKKKVQKKGLRKVVKKKVALEKTFDVGLNEIMKKEMQLNKQFQEQIPVEEKNISENDLNKKDLMRKEMELDKKYQSPVLVDDESKKEDRGIVGEKGGEPEKNGWLGKKIDMKAIAGEIKTEMNKNGKIKSEEKEGNANEVHEGLNLEELKWTPKISVGEETIDNQHKAILKEIINCEILLTKKKQEIQAIRDSMNFLSKYIMNHLKYEEKYLEKIKYPNIKDHKKIHTQFIKNYKQFKKEFEKKYFRTKTPARVAEEYAHKIHSFLGKWWINHIGIEDQKYAGFAKKKGSTKKEKSTPEEASKKPIEARSKFDVAAIAREIKGEIQKQRKPVAESLEDKKLEVKEPAKFKGKAKDYIFTGVPGFDDLLEQGIPKGNQLLVAGGAGSGKTIFCLQTLVNKAREGKRCLIMSLEENENKLIRHMEDFGWDAKTLIKKGKLKIMRINPFDITRNVDALLAKQKGELLIEVNPVILPEDFKKPDFIVIDSLTAIASAFTGKDESYRIYIEQLFRFLERTGSTGFLITETEQIPKIFSPTGVEEFLADGVIVMYNIKHGNVRENALELLKLRGAAHQKKIVAMQITGEGIIVYPEQEVFSDIE